MLVALLVLLAWSSSNAADPALQIGSKRFTESYLLGEILTQTAARHTPARHQQGLGNTAIVFSALKAGSIDLYPEYLGTINSEILKHTTPSSFEQIRQELAPLGLGIAVKLGFDNTYALAMRGTPAGGPTTLADLAGMPPLRLGLSHEFLGRVDGWPGLAQRYALPQQPTGLDHGIAYEALMAKQVDVIDIYSTDAKIGKLGLRVLTDTDHYFPSYEAVLLYRLDVPQRFPSAWAALGQLEGKIDNRRMIAMNAAVELDGQTFAAVATQFVAPTATAPGVRASFLDKLFGENFWRLTRQHVLLVAFALVGASLIGIPLGVLAAFVPRLRQTVMAIVGILQTVPALALLAMLIPLLGRIGTTPALIALFLYALLPIVRNTCTGMLQVPAGLRMAALALGLTPRDRLLHVDLPLALPVILAGLKTAAVMSVGTATIAAFIGAGGYGERIAIGLALNDNAMLLAGAIPAAVLALLTQWLFDWLEHLLIKGTAGH
ncbi:glycine betaine ABC transporter substrate-binding protein [Actimicrobium antarcticum]|uniref:Glycine betaine ABC transporter substrate-binding protein n=1 Tax=Actimicrobium antarcticum TaxID=1051899 RepID=A0ABP7SW48_9BURK